MFIRWNNATGALARKLQVNSLEECNRVRVCQVCVCVCVRVCVRVCVSVCVCVCVCVCVSFECFANARTSQTCEIIDRKAHGVLDSTWEFLADLTEGRAVLTKTASVIGLAPKRERNSLVFAHWLYCFSFVCLGEGFKKQTMGIE